MSNTALLSMRDVVSRTGIEAPTLRMWESRHGFPVPQRLPSGHRRYTERDVSMINAVVRARAGGLELRAAIDSARLDTAPRESGNEDSIYATLRRHRDDLTAYLLPKRTLISLSHAIEDESGSRGTGSVLAASFQRESNYRFAEPRWRDLCTGARFAVVLADFDAVSEPGEGPAEVPIKRADPIGREWSLICEGPRFAACLSAWERPGQDEVDDAERTFEAFWSVEPALVRDGIEITAAIVERNAPAVGARMREALVASRSPDDAPDRATLASLTNRMIAYLSEGRRSDALPAPS